MNDYFLYADDLKKKYKCYGHFYDLKFSSKNMVNCRSVLEIIDSSIPDNDIKNLSFRIPDTIFIMMNPGSSYPLEEPIKDIKEMSIDFRKKKNLVLTRPDNTQYQLMRIGVEMGWSHLRVLNLSDFFLKIIFLYLSIVIYYLLIFLEITISPLINISIFMI